MLTKVHIVKGPYGFCSCHIWMRELDHKAECWRTDAFELWALQSPLDSKEIQSINPKGNQSWIFIRRTDAEAEAPILWLPDGKNWLIGKRPWCWERLKAGEEGADRGWDGWMASQTRWTWVWANSGRWWWTGKPAVLQSMGSQRVGHDWVTEQNWRSLALRCKHRCFLLKPFNIMDFEESQARSCYKTELQNHGFPVQEPKLQVNTLRPTDMSKEGVARMQPCRWKVRVV